MISLQSKYKYKLHYILCQWPRAKANRLSKAQPMIMLKPTSHRFDCPTRMKFEIFNGKLMSFHIRFISKVVCFVDLERWHNLTHNSDILSFIEMALLLTLRYRFVLLSKHHCNLFIFIVCLLHENGQPTNIQFAGKSSEIP